MTRAWNDSLFEGVFDRMIVGGTFNEESAYYPRYKSRYKDLLQRYAELSPATPQRVLDVGGGQLGLICRAMWNDEAHAADIGGEHLAYLRSQGVGTTIWNLCADEQPFENQFDFVFFSEVIEHLPIPGHIVLERLRRALRPGGTLICSTPNLYRLRNIVFMVMGRRIYDHFRMPTNEGLGHVLEYSYEHLVWQLETAGFAKPEVVYVQMHHAPNQLADRILYAIGSPLFLVPRWRDNLVAIARH